MAARRGSMKMLVMAAVSISAMGGPAQAAERKILIGSFDDIVVDGDMTVNIVTGKSVSAKASGDRRILDAVHLERTGMTLKISMRSVINNEKSRPITEPLIINLTNKDLRNVTVRGNAKVNADAIKQFGPSRIGLSGGGEIQVGRVQADTVSVFMDGNGKINLGSGTTRTARYDINGGGTFDASGVMARTAEIRQIGNASTKASAIDSVGISNEGSGSIAVTGKAECFIRKAGMAQISCLKLAKAN